MLGSSRILIALTLCSSTFAIADDKTDLMIEEAMIYVGDVHEGKYRIRTVHRLRRLNDADLRLLSQEKGRVMRDIEN